MVHSSQEPRTALVTGSARRVGRALVQGLVERGWRVVVHATNEPRARQAAQELGALAGFGADLRVPDQCVALADRTAEAVSGRLDLLVNNAATFVRATPLHTGLEMWHEAMDVNARAPLLLVQRLAPALRAAGGSVVNVSDRAAHEHWLQYAVHSASKAALDSLTITLARELHPDVRVNAVAPGTILPPDDASEAFIRRKRQENDLGSPDDLLQAVLALVEDRTRSGQILVL